MKLESCLSAALMAAVPFAAPATEPAAPDAWNAAKLPVFWDTGGDVSRKPRFEPSSAIRQVLSKLIR